MRTDALFHPEHRRFSELGSDDPGGLLMKGLRRGLIVAAVSLAGALVLAACGGSSSSSSSSTTSAVNIAASTGGNVCGGLRFAVITHGDNGNFWSVVYKGAKNAAADLGCKLTEV
jgi:ABC-type sugar transport system substrate-binding protein